MKDSLLISLYLLSIFQGAFAYSLSGGGPRFDGIGVVNGGGATSVLLKDYPEPQRSQILDMVYRPMFGASVSALLVEVPGDGNSTQGSMPTHMPDRHTVDYTRGYTWWILREAKRRNPDLSLDAAAWSAPGWIGGGKDFWSQDAADYYITWLRGLRDVYGISLDAIGCRNEKGEGHDFARMLRRTLDANGFGSVRLHAFDNWYNGKLRFVHTMETDSTLRDAIDIISGHTFYKGFPVSPAERAAAERMHKPIWNTEDHVYLRGFDCLISLVACFNMNYIRSGATRITNWYDIAGIYPLEPYAVEPPVVHAYEPWSGHYRVRQALWGYAHYGQMTRAGWHYITSACDTLAAGGSVVAMRSDGGDYSIIIETRDATEPQTLHFRLAPDLKATALCQWTSDEREQFVRRADIVPHDSTITVTVPPRTVCSLSTTRGQQKGAFAGIPASRPFPLPYRDDFDSYQPASAYGCLPHYTADIAGAFCLVPDNSDLQQTQTTKTMGTIENNKDNRDNKNNVDNKDNNTSTALYPAGHSSLLTPHSSLSKTSHSSLCLMQTTALPTLSWAPRWKPYTIIGDSAWTDYEVSVDICLRAGDAGGVMGRLCHVGTGWGTEPKGYYAMLGSDGTVAIVCSQGKRDKRALVGDAEQQAAIRRAKDTTAGGERVLAEARAKHVAPDTWHRLTLRFKGSTITVFVDGRQVVAAHDGTYSHGMAGLIAQAYPTRLATPRYDNLEIN